MGGGLIFSIRSRNLILIRVTLLLLKFIFCIKWVCNWTYIGVDKAEWVGKQYVEHERTGYECVCGHEPCVGVKAKSEAMM